MTYLYPDPKFPYYIITPPYERTSAGIRCLHLLCHALNTRGFTSYIVNEPTHVEWEIPLASGTDFLTPHLTPQVEADHHRRGKMPIVVYPEIVKGNPYKAHCVVRYVLNFPGLLGGDFQYPAEELCFAYSNVLAQSLNTPENVLFIPPIDTRLFNMPPPETRRSGACFYADKFRKVHGGKPGPITEGCVEIVRQQEGEQTAEQVAALLKKSEVFYTYENTSLAIEAVLCGCPAVFIPNDYLTKIIAAEELGPEGYAWGTEEEDVSRARATVQQGAENYLKQIDAFWPKLSEFIEKSQLHAQQRWKQRPKVCSQVIFASEPVHYMKVSYGDIIYPSLLHAAFLSWTRALPLWLEREIAKFFSTVGLKSLGRIIWNSSMRRTRAITFACEGKPQSSGFPRRRRKRPPPKEDSFATPQDQARQATGSVEPSEQLSDVSHHA